LRGSAFGDVDLGLAAAKPFVASGTLAYRQTRGREKEPIDAARGDGAITAPIVLLTDNGTSGAAEVFAGALTGHRRATIVGERTLGRAARQKLVKLPDGSGLLLTHLLYLAPGGGAIHEKGLTPDVAVDSPDLDFGQAPPADDPVLEKAIDTLNQKAAA
jgi:carboxyl-terminal processing protease